jgi:hypothetical protein
MIVFLLLVSTASAVDSQGQKDFSAVGSPVPFVEVKPE